MKSVFQLVNVIVRDVELVNVIVGDVDLEQLSVVLLIIFFVFSSSDGRSLYKRVYNIKISMPELEC